MNTISIKAGDDAAALVQAFQVQLPDPAKRLSLLARFAVEAADGPKLEAAFGRAMPFTLKEPGCIVFTLNRDPRDPGRFVVYEQWRSLTDLEAHLRTDYVARLRAEVDELIVGLPEFQVLLPAA